MAPRQHDTAVDGSPESSDVSDMVDDNESVDDDPENGRDMSSDQESAFESDAGHDTMHESDEESDNDLDDSGMHRNTKNHHHVEMDEEDEEDEQAHDMDMEDEPDEDNNEEDEGGEQRRGKEPTLPTADHETPPVESVQASKARIATLCTKIVAAPDTQELPLLLRELLAYCESPNVAVAGLARFSAAKVFADIRPDYVIKLSEIKSQKGYSMDVRRRVYFEQNLLSYYGKFVALLKEEITARSLRRVAAETEVTQAARARILLRVVCELLRTCWHFNWHVTLIDLVCVFLFLPSVEYSAPASDALQHVVENDLRGDIALEVIRRIAKATQARGFKCHPNTLRPFLFVSECPDEINPFNQGQPQKPKLTRKTREALSRTKLKKLRLERKIDKDARLAEASYSKEERQKYAMLKLDTIFRTYFRILKGFCDSPLVPMVLEGMSLHTFKINYYFMRDIIALLERLLEQRAEALRVVDTVRVCQTIFRTVKLQDFMVSLDLVHFYNSMYLVLSQLPFQQRDFEGADNAPNRVALAECLKIMLLDIKTVPVPRVVAFVKRLLGVLVMCDGECPVLIAQQLTSMFKRYHSTFASMCEQESGSGQYNREIHQPDMCGAMNTSLWELTLLRRHHSPALREWAAEAIKLLRS